MDIRRFCLNINGRDKSWRRIQSKWLFEAQSKQGIKYNLQRVFIYKSFKLLILDDLINMINEILYKKFRQVNQRNIKRKILTQQQNIRYIKRLSSQINTQSVQMINQQQLMELVHKNIRLFNNQIQRNQKINPYISLHQSPQQKHIEKNKQNKQLKLDLWKVNNQINRKTHHTNQYIGPILSFQRRQIWARPHHHHYNPRHSQISIQHNHQNSLITPTQSRYKSQPKHTPPIYSDVKFYPLDQSFHKPNSYTRSNSINQHPHQNQLTNSKPKRQKRNHIIFNQESTALNKNIKRRNRIFTQSSSKVSHHQYPLQLGHSIPKNSTIHSNQHTITNLQSHQPIIQQNNQQNHIIYTHHPYMHYLPHQQISIQPRMLQPIYHYQNIVVRPQSKISPLKHRQSSPRKQNLETQLNKPQQKAKYNPIQKSRTILQINETDYVPSPSQLSTILKTIQLQSKQTKYNSHGNGRKSLYHKKLHDYITYHEKNLYKPPTNLKSVVNQNYIPSGLNVLQTSQVISKNYNNRADNKTNSFNAESSNKQ